MTKHTYNILVKFAIGFALAGLLTVGAFADYNSAREYNFNQVTLASTYQYMYEINFRGKTYGNYRFSDELHHNGIYRYNAADYDGGTLAVPYPQYEPCYVDYLYQSDNLPSPSNGFNKYDILTFACKNIDLTIPEGYCYIDFEAVSFTGTFTGFSLVYEQDEQTHYVTLDHTSPNVHTKSITYLPNFSQAQSYSVTSTVSRYVIDTTGIIPVSATLKEIQANIGFPCIPLTTEIYNQTPAYMRHVNYVCYITPVFITVNETDVSRILYETRLTNDQLTTLASTNRDIYEAIQRNNRYERMIDDFLATMGTVHINHDVTPDVESAAHFFSTLYYIDPIPSMLGITITFLCISAFLRKGT